MLLVDDESNNVQSRFLDEENADAALASNTKMWVLMEFICVCQERPRLALLFCILVWIEIDNVIFICIHAARCARRNTPLWFCRSFVCLANFSKQELLVLITNWMTIQ